MIKEMAFSLSNRHHFVESAQVSDWYGTSKDTFCSLYDYDDYVKDFIKKNRKLSGFDGKIYIPSEFLLDVDGETVDNAKQKTVGLTLLLNDLGVPFNVYFSGTGFHVGIPQESFIWAGARDLHLKVKDALTAKGIFEFADPAVTDKTRIIRLLNTKNFKSGLFKVYLKLTELHEHVETIITLAKRPRNIEIPRHECNPIFDVRVRKGKGLKVTLKPKVGRKPDIVNYPCIQSMMTGVAKGSRHAVALRIASHLRWRYPEEVVNAIMHSWRERVTNDSSPFTEKEMNSIIDHCYTGHGGEGTRYGCYDVEMDRYCKQSCKLYKAKKSQQAMDSTQMEKVLVDFIRSDLKPIDIGKEYGKRFPIYPGEVVIVQGPPKSMKTMLLQNWLNTLKVPTYFLEMEMSPRQMMMRFAMMETGMNEEQVVEHYKAGKNGLADKFKWLTIDYSPCRAFELQKRIQMQAIRPQVIVVDHMGLFHSAQRDNNMKVEEASQALMELAIQNNVVVFAVSEIGKESFREGQNIASSRGSFRVAYNANKIIGINADKDKDGLVSLIKVKTIANREREVLNVNLTVDNVKISLSNRPIQAQTNLVMAKKGDFSHDTGVN